MGRILHSLGMRVLVFSQNLLSFSLSPSSFSLSLPLPLSPSLAPFSRPLPPSLLSLLSLLSPLSLSSLRSLLAANAHPLVRLLRAYIVKSGEGLVGDAGRLEAVLGIFQTLVAS